MKNLRKIFNLAIIVSLTHGTALAKKKAPQTLKKQAVDQLRFTYLAAHDMPQPDTPRLPKEFLDSPLLPPIESATLLEVQKAKALADADQVQVNSLRQKRYAALAKKHPIYRELLQLSQKVTQFKHDHAQELEMAQNDPIYLDLIHKAENKAAIAWGNYWNLQWQYNREHSISHGPVSILNIPKDMNDMIKVSPRFNLLPGSIITDRTVPGLPVLHSGNGTNNPGAVIDYALYSSSGKKFPATLTTKTVSDGIYMPGHSSDTYYYRLAIDKYVSSGEFSVVAKHADGTLSVLFTITVSKKGAQPRPVSKPLHKGGRKEDPKKKTTL